MSAVLLAREPNSRYLATTEPALLRGFDLIARAPGGVPKLRALVLEFAVQGRLVRQDGSDEPASLLVQRAQAERGVLTGRRSTRSFDSSDAHKAPLPVGWCRTSLGEIGHISPRNEATDDTVASFVQMSSVPAGMMERHKAEERQWRDIKSGFTHFAEGDVGLAKITPCFENGKSTVFRNLANGIGAGTTELHVVRPLVGLLPEYILIFLKSPGFLRNGEAMMTGSAGQKRVPRAYFEGTPFPVPPIAEQHRIVARVEELMKLCDALEQTGRLADEQHARLTSTLFDALAASESAHALAENWLRIAEHFDLLLDRPEAVDALEQTIIQLAVEGMLIGPGRSSGEWRDGALGDMVDLLNGYAFKSDSFRATGVRLVRNVNVSHGSLAWNDAACVDRTIADELSRFALSAGDVVLSLDRPIISTGLKYAVVQQHDLPCLLLQRVARLKPLEHTLEREYLELWLNSPDFVGRIDPGRSNGVPHISTRQLQKIPIGLPPLPEQRRIVARVEELRCLCSDLRRHLVHASDTQSRLANALAAMVE